MLVDIEKFPKVYEMYKEYILNQVNKIKDLDKEVMAALPVEGLIKASISNSGKLYEFLDNKGLIVCVNKQNDIWSYYINQDKEDTIVKTRPEVEQLAFHKTFTILEK